MIVFSSFILEIVFFLQFSFISEMTLKSFILATRPWSLSASLVLVFLGNIYAYKQSEEKFNIFIAMITTVCVICVHIAGNLINTYYDFKNGVDGPRSSDTTLIKGDLKPNQVLELSILSYVVSTVSILVLILFTNIETKLTVTLFIIGALLSYCYTGGLKMKYFALGDIAIISAFGPVTVLFAFASQTNVLSWKPVLASIPLVCLTEAILHVNNCRDLEEDRKSGITTMAILLGANTSYFVYTSLITLPFLSALIMGFTSHKLFLLPLILSVKGRNLIRRCYENKFLHLVEHTAELNLLYGVLYSFALFWS